MSVFLSFILGTLTIWAPVGIILWPAFGRRKQGEDRAIGGLEAMAHFKSASSVDAMQRRVR